MRIIAISLIKEELYYLIRILDSSLIMEKESKIIFRMNYLHSLVQKIFNIRAECVNRLTGSSSKERRERSGEAVAEAGQSLMTDYVRAAAAEATGRRDGVLQRRHDHVHIRYIHSEMLSYS